MLVTSGEIFYGDARTDETNIPRLVINYDRFGEREREREREREIVRQPDKSFVEVPASFDFLASAV